ncbi:MAG: small multi-drug export protein [Oscillospiraceae bacterium]|nr:small multi-drug export protein [Oscillospiraceae bacterium]
MAIAPEVLVFLISMVPVAELRGAIPYGVAAELPFWSNFLISILGNMLPVTFVVLFIRKVFAWLRTISFFKPFVDWSEKHVLSKQDVIAKYEIIGLIILVAIPLPGTGAWTGAMLAGLLGMRLKDAIPSIFVGVVVAALVVSAVSYGLIGAIDLLALHA